ncbi:MAG TPA: ATP-dependent DNA ligase [Acidimicrobiales bacterium]|nr:ATP-dependent DNA ligase [Acidimicrobiales bacterium]
MDLPVRPPVAPMLAKASATLPEGEGLVYEPKWDGFRCIVFRDGDEVELGSRNERPLTRYFPELVAECRAHLPARCVVDGEVVIAGPDGLDFEALLARIHPAQSRIDRLAAETPASFVAFDLLALGDEDLRGAPFAERRRLLESALGGLGGAVHLTPATRDVAVARDWFSRFEGAGLDGVVVKQEGLAYLEDKRVMTKVKHERRADCVVAGFRWHASGGRVGSLLLGLYDASGHLQHVGVTASFTDRRRLELVEELAPYRTGVEDHPWAAQRPAGEAPSRRPGAQSRWNQGKDLSFEPLRPELVCEVSYDHLQGDRFRHATTFRRWRPDRDPASCRYDQLEAAVPAELAEVFAS